MEESNEASYSDGWWTGHLPGRPDIAVSVKDSVEANPLADAALISRIVAGLSRAEAFAIASEYRREILRFGGISIHSINIESPTDVFVWYRFANWPDGHLAVLLKNDIPSSVYCDFPGK